jgi:prevent-host-death family protein
MQIPVNDAADQLDELIDRARNGEEIVLTVDGRPAVIIEVVAQPPVLECR